LDRAAIDEATGGLLGEFGVSAEIGQGKEEYNIRERRMRPHGRLHKRSRACPPTGKNNNFVN